MRTIELLAPAKNYEYGCAAVDCGADALYVGAPGFGARVDAAVSVGDIARLCDYAHRFGVRVFVTMNTLVLPTNCAGRTHRPRSMPRGRRCADRAGYGFSADASSAGRVAPRRRCITMTPTGRGFGRRRFSEFSSALQPGGDTRDCRRGSDTGIETFVHRRFASHTAGSAT
ncbi:MAG: peptidase U32 family protein [Alistipes sp.]